MPTIQDILNQLESTISLDLAAEWDNVGLLLGDAGSDTNRIMTCLTLTEAVAAEAVDARVQLIISHHPIFFRGTKRLTTATPEGRMALSLSRAGVAVYSPHSAFDNAPGGINAILA